MCPNSRANIYAHCPDCKSYCVVIIVTKDEVTSPCSHIPTWTYDKTVDPEMHKNYYYVPVYNLHVYKATDYKNPATYIEKETFQCLRFFAGNKGRTALTVFGVQNDPTDSNPPKTWHLAHIITYTTNSEKPRQVKLAVKIHNDFLIHEGPSGCWDHKWAANGCVEIVGPWELDRFFHILAEYSEAKSSLNQLTINPLQATLPIWVKYEDTPRPSIGDGITQLTKEEFDYYTTEFKSNFSNLLSMDKIQYFPSGLY